MTEQPDTQTVLVEAEPEIECCPTCGGILDHVLGCPEMDAPR